MFILNKYSKCYFRIIEVAKSRTLASSVYVEKHHIIPKSCGGSNDKPNIVKLTPREHFICHLLLPKMLSGTYHHKMVHALWRMCNSLKSDYKVTSKTYSVTKQAHASILSTVGLAGQFKKGHKPWNYGIPRTAEEKALISKAKLGQKTGRTSADFTPEWKSKISESKKQQTVGASNSMYGKKHSEESRLKMSNSRKAKANDPTWNIRPPCSAEKALKIKEANKGKRWVHNKATKERKYIDPSLVAEFLSLGWEFGIGPRS